MSGAAHSVNYSAKLVTGSDITAGQCLVADTVDVFVLSTLANRGTKRTDGIAVTSSVPGASVLMVTVGRVEAAVTGIGVGAETWVRVSDAGYLERCSAGDPGDIVGWAEADGVVHMMCGFLNSAITAGTAGDLPNGTKIGQMLRITTVGPPSTWSVKDTGQYYVTDYGITADCTIGDATTGTDQSAAIQALVDIVNADGAGLSRTIFFPECPAGLSYRIDTAINCGPHRILGVGASVWGEGGTQITCPAEITPFHGVHAPFVFHNLQQSQNGYDATGFVLEGFVINLTPTLSMTNWQSTHAFSLNEYVRPTTTNLQFSKTIIAGTTGSTEPAWTVNPHVPDRSFLWQTGLALYYGAHVRSTNSAHWDVLFFVTTPALGAGSITTTGSEPSWDYTVGHTTTSGGITYECIPNPAIAQDGTAMFATHFHCGVYATCPGTIQNICVKSPGQGPGISWFGSDTTWGSDSNGWKILDCRVVLASGRRGVGVYTRGGSMRFGFGTRVYVLGTAPHGMDNYALGADGTDRYEDGIHDESFAEANVWSQCWAKYCGGFDFSAAGGSSGTIFLGCVSDFGRLNMNQVSQWLGNGRTGTFWYDGQYQGYGSLGMSHTREYAYGWKAICPGIVDTHTPTFHMALTAANYPTGFQITDSDDTGGYAWTRGSFAADWWHWCHSQSAAKAAFGFSTCQAFINSKQLGGAVFSLPRGFLYGDPSALATSCLFFPSVISSKDYLVLGCLRRVGDRRIKDPTAAAGGGFLEEVVTTAGYTAPTWAAVGNYFAKIAAPADNATPAQCVVPTTPNGYAYQATATGISGMSEPTWPTTIGLTVVDGTVTWTCVGITAEWTDCNPVYPVGGGGGGPAGSDTWVQYNDGGSSFGAEANFTYDDGSNTLTVNGIVSTVSILATTEIAIGAAPAGVGAEVRLSNDGKIEFRDSGDSVNVSALNVDSAEAVILGGTNATAISAKVGSAETIRADGSTVDIKPAGTTKLQVSANNVLGAVPYLGLASPWGVHGEIDIDVGGITPYTLSSSEYIYETIRIANDANSQVVVTPTPGDLAHSYMKIFLNVGEFDMAVSNGGTDMTVSTGQGILCWVRTDGVYAIAQFGAW